MGAGAATSKRKKHMNMIRRVLLHEHLQSAGEVVDEGSSPGVGINRYGQGKTQRGDMHKGGELRGHKAHAKAAEKGDAVGVKGVQQDAQREVGMEGDNSVQQRQQQQQQQQQDNRTAPGGTAVLCYRRYMPFMGARWGHVAWGMGHMHHARTPSFERFSSSCLGKEVWQRPIESERSM